MTTTVLICDDDPIVREALASYINGESSMEVCCTLDSAEDALARMAAERPDVVLMDLVLPGIDGIEATQRIRAEHPDIAVLMLTTFGTDEQVKKAIAAGATGFLLKSTTADALVAAVRAAAAGAGTVITPELASHLATAPIGHGEDSELARSSALALGLTEREADVLRLLCAAESNAGIAEQLMLSESTVKTHVSSLMTKLGCTSRLQIAVRAFEKGLVAAPGPASGSEAPSADDPRI